MKNIFLFCVLLYTNFLFASNSNDYDNFQKAKAFFIGEKYQKSIDILQIILQKDISNVNINFYLGRSYFMMKEYEQALIYFERITIINENHLRAYLEIARTYMKLGLNEAALRNFKFVRESNIPYYVKENVESYIRFIENKKKKNLYRAFLTAGVTYDNNINNVTDTQIFDTPTLKNIAVQDEQVEDTHFIVSASGIHNYRVNENVGLENTINLISQSFSHNSSNNLLLVNYKSTFSHLLNKDKIDYGIEFSHIILNTKNYLNVIGLNLQYTKKIDNKLDIFSAYHYIDKTYLQPENYNLDTNTNQIDAGLNYKTINYGNFIVSSNIQKDKLQQQNNLNINHLYKKNGKLSFISTFSYTNTKQRDKDTIFDIKQEDNLNYLSFGIAYNLKKYLIVSSSIKQIKNSSNINIYSYDKNTIDLFLKYSF